MNLTGEEHPRVIAMFSPSELTWALNSWTADGVAPPRPPGPRLGLLAECAVWCVVDQWKR
eukprot:1935923-Amphidinium_carterae.1